MIPLNIQPLRCAVYDIFDDGWDGSYRRMEGGVLYKQKISKVSQLCSYRNPGLLKSEEFHTHIYPYQNRHIYPYQNRHYHQHKTTPANRSIN